jgi:hypothetical protein
MLEPAETLIVCVNGSRGGRYWFSDRRIIAQGAHDLSEILRYAALLRVYWMFKDLYPDRMKALRSSQPSITAALACRCLSNANCTFRVRAKNGSVANSCKTQSTLNMFRVNAQCSRGFELSQQSCNVLDL